VFVLCPGTGRDVSPENVLLDGQGGAVLADLGLCVLTEASALVAMDRGGKPGYQAPEVHAYGQGRRSPAAARALGAWGVEDSDWQDVVGVGGGAAAGRPGGGGGGGGGAGGRGAGATCAGTGV
jgi:hypothetical protein